MAQRTTPPTEAADPVSTTSPSEFVIPEQYRDDAEIPGDLIIRAASMDGTDMVDVRCHAYPLWKTKHCSYFKTILKGDWAETSEDITQKAPANGCGHSTVGCKPSCAPSGLNHNSSSSLPDVSSAQSNFSTRENHQRILRATISFPDFDVATICAFLEYMEDPGDFAMTLQMAQSLSVFADLVGHAPLLESAVDFMFDRLREDPVGIWSAAQRARATSLYYTAGLLIMLSWNDDLEDQVQKYGEVWRDMFITTRMDFLSHIGRAAGIALVWAKNSGKECPLCELHVPPYHAANRDLRPIFYKRPISLAELKTYWDITWPGAPNCQCQKQAMTDTRQATERLRLPTNSAKNSSK